MTNKSNHFSAGPTFPIGGGVEKACLIQIDDHPLRLAGVGELGRIANQCDRHAHGSGGCGDFRGKHQIAAQNERRHISIIPALALRRMVK